MEWTHAEIKRRREAKQLSQDQLAELLGVSRRAVTNWETGRADPRGSSLRRLERVLGDAPVPEIGLSSATLMQLLAEIASRYSELEAQLDARQSGNAAPPLGVLEWRTADAPSSKRANGYASGSDPGDHTR